MSRDTGDYRNKKTHRSQVYLFLKNMTVKVGVKNTLGTHTIRCSRATNLLNAGIDTPMFPGS